MMLGWGAPLLLTALGFGIWQEKHYGDSIRCFVKGIPPYTTLVAPISLILTMNIIGFVIIMLTLSRRPQCCNDKSKKMVAQVRITTGIALLFGFTWVFEFLVAFDHRNEAFQYLFCILASLHGVFIFLFHCVGNEKMRMAWKRSFILKKYPNVPQACNKGEKLPSTERNGVQLAFMSGTTNIQKD